MLQAKLIKEECFVLEEVDIPDPAPDEVLLKVEMCGICGSDLHTYHGKHPFVKPPIVMGHEFSGTIAKLGDQVSDDYRLGQRVAVEPSVTCGECCNCRHGRYNICDDLNVLGCLSDGAYTQFYTVSAAKLIPLDDKLSFEDGAMLEPLSVGIHAADQGQVEKGDKVLVIGAGTIGLLLAQACKARGAKVAVADVLDNRLELAESLGLDVTINTKTNSLEERLAEFAPEGVDTIFECVGLSFLIRECVEIARKGSRIVVVGVVDEDVSLPVHLLQDRELELVGTLMFTREDFELAQQLIVSEKVNVKALQTKTFPLSQVKEAFEHIFENKDSVLKVFLNPQQ